MGEEAVGVDLAHGQLDRLGAEGTADLLQGEEIMGGGVFDEVDVGEAALGREKVSVPPLASVGLGKLFRARGRANSGALVSLSYLAKEPLDLEAPAVDLEGGRSGEAVEAVPEGVEEVEEDLRHGGWIPV